MSNIESPLVSIGIPTYNRLETYFPLTLESALRQTYPMLEIIVSDNGSTDGTREYMNSVSDDRVRYVRHDPPLKPHENFNFCVQQASGRYFLLLHDDDLVDPDFVTSCIAAVRRRGDAGLVRTGVKLIDEKGCSIREYPNMDSELTKESFVEKWLDGRAMVTLCNTLYNTSELRAQGGFDSPYHLFNDVAAAFRVLAEKDRVDVENVLASFRKHKGQRTGGAVLDNWINDSLFLKTVIVELFGRKIPNLPYKADIHFSKHNYDLALGVGDWWTRIRVVSKVYREFGKSLHPLKWYSQRLKLHLFTKLGIVKRRVQRAVVNAPRGEERR